MAMHLSQPAPAVASRRPDLPAPLAAVIDRCLRRDPTLRYASGDELREALEVLKVSRLTPELLSESPYRGLQS
ncbi:MAG: hypothetical protein ABL977_01250, partial [Candidatus Eisenbacteria bacterium]